jgi:peptidoglycan hydrolase-like protein with peptidoglycan-binding domain
VRIYPSLNVNPAAEPTLTQGSSGRAVTDLQEALVNAGFNPNGVDGSFGPGTRNAVVAFQRAHGLTADGVVGPNTWRNLAAASNAAPASSGGGSPVLHQGDTGTAVAELQRELAADGFSAGAADGIFGSGTLAAVERFQGAQGLSADGVVGNQTWGALAHPHATGGSGAASGSATVQAGSSGPAVAELQRLLTGLGFDTQGSDGVFGQHTLTALLSFQGAAGLSADGVCGPNTWAKLRAGAVHAGGGVSHGGGATGQATISLGASGPAVTELQQLLARANFSPGAIDGQFGGGTQSAVVGYQVSRGLTPDGVVGPATWQALTSGAPAVNNGPVSAGDLRARILAIAESQIGLIETTNNNDGAILKFPNYFGRGSESWCNDFVSWVYTHAGDNINYAYVPYYLDHLIQTGKWKGQSNPQPGDTVLFDWNGDGTPDHIGIVKSVNGDGTIQTIEGNSAVNGQNEGVWEHTRSMGTILGFGNP